MPGTAAEAVCAKDASTADKLLVALSKLPRELRDMIYKELVFLYGRKVEHYGEIRRWLFLPVHLCRVLTYNRFRKFIWIGDRAHGSQWSFLPIALVNPKPSNARAFEQVPAKLITAASTSYPQSRGSVRRCLGEVKIACYP